MQPIPSDIVKAIAEHDMTTARVGKRIVFTSNVTGKEVWAVNDAAAARRFVESCRINSATISHIVQGRL